MSSEDYPRRHPETSFRAIDDEGGYVVQSDRKRVQVLNPVGIMVFGLLDGRHSTEQIAAMVAEEFDVTPEQAAEDVRAFLDQLEAHGMLADSAAPAHEGSAG